jgi:hypothetical protein
MEEGLWLLLDNDMWRHEICPNMDPLSVRYLSMTCRHFHALLKALTNRSTPLEDVAGHGPVEIFQAMITRVQHPPKAFDKAIESALLNWNLPVLQTSSPVSRGSMINILAGQSRVFPGVMRFLGESPYADLLLPLAVAWHDPDFLSKVKTLGYRVMPPFFRVCQYFPLTLPLLKRLVAHGLRPDENSLHDAFRTYACDLDVLDWLWDLYTVPGNVSPTLLRSSSIDKLKWRQQKFATQLFDHVDMNVAIRNDALDTVEWLVAQGVRPTEAHLGIALLATDVSVDMLRLLRDVKCQWSARILPGEPIEDCWQLFAIEKIAFLVEWHCPKNLRAKAAKLLRKPHKNREGFVRILQASRFQYLAGLDYSGSDSGRDSDSDSDSDSNSAYGFESWRRGDVFWKDCPS